MKLSAEIRRQVELPELWSLLLLKFLVKFEGVKETGVYLNTAWREVFLDDFCKDKIFKKGWRDITRLTEKGMDTLNLQKAFLAAFAEKVVVTVENGDIGLTPSVNDALAYLKEFVALLGSEKSIFVVDSYQPSIHFESLFGKVVPVVWGKHGDPLKTNSQQLVLCDTAHWGFRDFLNRRTQEKIRENVERFVSKFKPENVIIITLSKKMADAVFKWGLPKEVMVTWFRSEWSRGVPIEGRRVMIILAGPYIPKRAYVPQSTSFKVEDFVTEMEELQSNDEKAVQLPRLLKLDDMRGEFVNCIGRVKDPEGKQRSLVVAFGMRESEVRAFLRDNSPFRLLKPKLVRTVYGGGMIDEGMVIAELWMKHSAVTDPQDLRVLARIIVLVKQKRSVPASQVVFGKTELVKTIALMHQQVLDKFGVIISFKTGGVTFEAK